MHSIKTSVNTQFSKVADNYRTSKVHAQGEDLEQIVTLVQQSHNPTVLDAGCGAGHTAITVAPYSRQVIAFDLTASMLEQVERVAMEQGITNLETRLGDVEQLPFEANQFEVVVSRYSAHHWPNPAKALTEAARVLKPGGRFILSDIVAPAEPALDTFLQTLELLRDPSHVRDHSVAQWCTMFEQAGFQVQPVYQWRVPLNFEQWLHRMATPPLNTTMLKTLYDGASQEIRDWFDIRDGYDFTIDGALFEAMLLENF